MENNFRLICLVEQDFSFLIVICPLIEDCFYSAW